MRRRGTRWCCLALGCLLSVSWQASVSAQTQASGSAGLGLGYLAIPQVSGGGSGVGQNSLAVVPMSTSTASTSATALATPAGRAAAVSSDPMGFGYVYGGVYGGAAIPMTQAQAGLLMLSTSQRMLGLGNGQISGVRPGTQKDPQTGRAPGGAGAAAQHTAAHTRNANIPGGQAARYFGRGIGSPATLQAQTSRSRSQPYYQRQMRYFPQTTQ